MATTYFIGDDEHFFDGASEVSNVISISGPSTSRELREVPPCLGDTVKEKRPIQLVDGGELTLSLLYDGTNADSFEAKLSDSTSSGYSLKEGDGTAATTIISYDAWVTGVEFGTSEHGSEPTAEVKMAVDGTATWGA